jgi:hypothetical protein
MLPESHRPRLPLLLRSHHSAFVGVEGLLNLPLAPSALPQPRDAELHLFGISTFGTAMVRDESGTVLVYRQVSHQTAGTWSGLVKNQHFRPMGCCVEPHQVRWQTTVFQRHLGAPVATTSYYQAVVDTREAVEIERGIFDLVVGEP